MEQAFANISGLGRPRPDLDKLARPTVDLKIDRDPSALMTRQTEHQPAIAWLSWRLTRARSEPFRF